MCERWYSVIGKAWKYLFMYYDDGEWIGGGLDGMAWSEQWMERESGLAFFFE